MLRANINDQQVVIRFPLSYLQREEIEENQIIQEVYHLGEQLLSYKDDCFALETKNGDLVIVYVQSGEVLDIQIQQVVLQGNRL
ncbi:hypothetical protein [Bacillus sp. AK128]